MTGAFARTPAEHHSLSTSRPVMFGPSSLPTSVQRSISSSSSDSRATAGSYTADRALTPGLLVYRS